MVKAVSKEAWTRYKALLPKTRNIYEPVLPGSVPYQGKIEGSFDYVLPEELLQRLRDWLSQNGQTSVYYFLTESVEGETTDFEINTEDLTHNNMLKLNKANENVIVARDFTWAVFVDHDGTLHVSGPNDLFFLLSAVH